jgi:hypothetical protein
MSAKTDESINSTLLSACSYAPQNATLKADGATLKVVAAKSGGQCDSAAAAKEFKTVQPVLNKIASVHVSMKTLSADVSDSEAQASADAIVARVKDGVPLVVNVEQLTVPTTDFLSWLNFTASGDTVSANVSAEKASEYLTINAGVKLAIAAGTVTITTRDFAEVSRSGGGDGRALSIDGTVASLNDYLAKKVEQAQAATQVVPATINYIRTYSSTDEGINALFTNFAKDHPGTYGISYAELYGDRRRANYQGDMQFVTASTYKLLGYGRMPKSTLIRKLEAGNRDIYADFIRYCHYKGKKIPSIERRRKEEYRLLFMP